MHHATFRQLLQALRDVLSRCGETSEACQVADVLAQDDQQVDAFLVSNELWGGAGSIADQAGCNAGRDTRRIIECALIDLGEAQVRAGITNIRTTRWVDAFRSWQNQGI